MYLNIDHNLLVASSSLVCLMYANANASCSCYNFLFLYLYYNILHDINIQHHTTTTLYDTIIHYAFYTVGTITITVTLNLK